MPKKIHIVQDECAPDGYEYFTTEVYKEIGITFELIKRGMKMIDDLGDTLVYKWRNYTIKNELGIYSIKS